MSETPSSLGRRRRARAVLARTGRGTCSPGADVGMGGVPISSTGAVEKKGVRQGAAGRRLRTGQAMRRPTPRLIAGDQRVQWVTLRPVGSVALTTNSASRARSSAVRVRCHGSLAGADFSASSVRCTGYGLTTQPRAWHGYAPPATTTRNLTNRKGSKTVRPSTSLPHGVPLIVAVDYAVFHLPREARSACGDEPGLASVAVAQGSVTAQWQSEPPKRHCGFGQTFASLISA